MVGIKAWEQQVPLPQRYVGENAWRIPLDPVPATTPTSTKTASCEERSRRPSTGCRSSIRSTTATKTPSSSANSTRTEAIAVGPTTLTTTITPPRPIRISMAGFMARSRSGTARSIPSPEPLRPAMRPLRGATIVGITSPSSTSRLLTYEVGGRRGTVAYVLGQGGSLTFYIHRPIRTDDDGDLQAPSWRSGRAAATSRGRQGTASPPSSMRTRPLEAMSMTVPPSPLSRRSPLTDTTMTPQPRSR